MFINKLLPRDLANDVTTTAGSFKSWDTCMDNTTCKIVAIVGIVLAVLVCLWLISTVIRCCCMGVSCLEALCCCCCRSANTRYVEKQTPMHNPNMYAPVPPPMYQHRGVPPATSQPQQAYFTSNQGYEPVRTNEYHTDENPFSDSKNTYNGHHM
ncbi:uncharacterized protein CANTADRAFT_53117 [Suhomyces tanzawaensis NRRL Y-17324]|uniref:Uncharacterized protein n=1 Tax=Suhomyces tanzawaensis NRRL Y-17324 TaxID=984487 RepID=A0A1E4SGK7_9ASCO|nr:uncharacterized protein CANTADRAFT_53117 [Suhomyces tanzawaensis NRRL Y-17324]ODV78600.1 hypothetical protein CANTADRAFT_53117 [Suhomyces tanzawaensis NRRL Y-17324]